MDAKKSEKKKRSTGSEMAVRVGWECWDRYGVKVCKIICRSWNLLMYKKVVF